MAEAAVPAIPLPTGDPGAVRLTARSLDAAADRLTGLGRRGVTVLDGTWRGEAAVSAAGRVARLASRLVAEGRRCGRAADALWVYATRLDWALDRAAVARRQLDAAYATQRAAGAADPALVIGLASPWSGSGDVFSDPAAVQLAEQARRAAWDADELATRAARELVAELEELTGLAFERRSLSPRLLLDVAGIVPVVGDAVDAVNGLVYLLQGDEASAALSLGAVVPGPPGWAAGGGRVGRALTDAEVVDVVRRSADPLQARLVEEAFVPLYRDRERLVRRAMATADQRTRPFVAHYGQIEKKYKHAEELFGLPANGNPRHWPAFEHDVRRFVESGSTVRIAGTYRGETAILYVDVVDMRRTVVAHPDGSLWSGWVLHEDQATNVWERHAL